MWNYPLTVDFRGPPFMETPIYSFEVVTYPYRPKNKYLYFTVCFVNVRFFSDLHRKVETLFFLVNRLMNASETRHR